MKKASSKSAAGKWGFYLILILDDFFAFWFVAGKRQFKKNKNS